MIFNKTLKKDSNIIDKKTKRKVILIIGMARSGTSMLGGILSSLGVYFGKNLAEPSSMNKKGFFENKEIVRINDQILLDLGAGWPNPFPFPFGWSSSSTAAAYEEKIEKLLKSEFQGRAIYGVKDPTITRLLPLWAHLLEKIEDDPLYIQIIRDPYEVYASMAYGQGAGKGIKPEQACLLWLRHNLEGEKYTQWKKRIFVKYDALLENPPKMIKIIAEFCEIIISDETLQKTVHFIDTSMKHYHSASAPVTFAHPFSLWASRVYSAFPKIGTEINTPVLEEVNTEIEKLDRINFLSGLYNHQYKQ